jgi:DNA (cytosine-5)-methyltransferase 1
VDLCVNHSADAVAMHAINHPCTEHLISDVFEVDPVAATRGRQVGLLWASPDCKHFSKAKGGKPRSKKIRSLAWVVVKWAAAVKPRVIMLENVEEFVTWGPLGKDGQPCPIRKGFTFRRWKRELQRLGYQVEHRELRACDYGAPTIRKRLFLIARCDGQPIVWPAPTHGKPDSIGVIDGKLLPWRTAAECIDWSRPCPSIFLSAEEARAIGVKRPLAEATMRRIYKGVQRFVLQAAKPFIVPIQNYGWGENCHDIDAPVRTIMANPKGGAFALVAPTMVKNNFGEKPAHGVDEPLHTVTTQGNRFALTSAFLTKYRADNAGSNAEAPFPTITANGESLRRGGNPPLAIVEAHLLKQYGGHESPGWPLDQPISTVTSQDHHHLVAVHMEQANGGTYRGEGRSAEAPLSTVCTAGHHQQLVASSLVKLRNNCAGEDMEAPLGTVTGGGMHHAEVRAFLIKFYSTGGQHSACDDPMHTIPSTDRMGLVTVDGTDYAIADIGLRMLTPRELFRAQGFPESYVIDVGLGGKKLPKDAQVRMCGNSVCPPMAKALVEANVAAIQRVEDRMAA